MIKPNLEHVTPVLIIEDDAFVQERLKKILIEIGFAASEIVIASTLTKAHQCTKKYRFKLVLVDLGLPDGHGSSFIQEFHLDEPQAFILVISAWSTQDHILKALNAGATGYLLKERDDMEISFAILSVLRGGAPIDPFIARQILISTKLFPQTNHLTETSVALSSRETEILELVSQGMTNKEIAEKINLSRYTIEGHIKNVYRKLSVSSRTQAINAARELGLVK